MLSKTNDDDNDWLLAPVESFTYELNLAFTRVRPTLISLKVG